MLKTAELTGVSDQRSTSFTKRFANVSLLFAKRKVLSKTKKWNSTKVTLALDGSEANKAAALQEKRLCSKYSNAKIKHCQTLLFDQRIIADNSR